MAISEKILQILVVEDDMLDQKIIKKALSSAGFQHELTFADDHETGKAATDGKEYDCIFLDYNLPGGTGLELLQAIRKSGNCSPIILVTSQGDEKLAVEAMRNGADDYIPKNLLSSDGIFQTIRYIQNIKDNERKQRELEDKLKETQKQLNTVVVNAPIILFSLDQTGTFKLFEGKGLENLGLKKEDILNKNITNEVSGLPIKPEEFERSSKGEEFTVIVEWKDKFFEIYYSPIRSEDSIDGIIGIATDITIHKRAEEELKKAKQMAEDTARVKEQFLANMSHEIRTPMNGIMGLTRIVLNTTLEDEQRKYLESIRTCTDNLLVIINDILDFSKIEAGKMNFENVPFNINDVIRHTVELFQTKADEKSLQLITETAGTVPVCLNGDPTRLSQIMNNLVSNAIKFTESGDVKIRTHVAGITDDTVTLSFDIKDSGIGIPEKSLASVFESFTQASSDTTRKFGGTGLGLTIVKKMIELQGGEITVQSKEGSGTTFSFTLTFPIAKEVVTTNTLIQIDEVSISHLRILIAEDNKINQLIVKKLFADWKTTIEFADNGLMAFELVQKSKFDLVLMDIQMPIMDGYTAVEHIRQNLPEPLCSIPIMAMTAHATQSEKQKCYDKGMNDYISKPFEPLDLKKKILELTQSLNITATENCSTTTVKQPNESVAKKTLDVNDPAVKEKITQEVVNQPKINLTYLKQLADGNDTFIIEMIEMFLNNTPSALTEMNDYFKQENWKELRLIAHKIKPSYGYFGLPELQSQLAEIEQLSEEQRDAARLGSLIIHVSAVSHNAFELLKKELTALSK